ncbi:MAG: gliding motility protein GldL [Bacteroidales bacterium]
MGKYKGFKNRLEKFFSSEQGQRLFNFAYSFGAAIVILGALFKLLHLPMADVMLCVGMGTEALIFGLSAFDKPAKNYHWENVFPSLASDEYVEGGDLQELARNMNTGSGLNTIQPQAATATAASAQPVANVHHVAPQGGMPHAAPELAHATQLYVQQMSEMTAQMERLKEITASLTSASGSLLNSYSTISDNSDNLSSFSSGYINQMEALNRNITGLNTIYEIQLKSVSSQLDTIDKVNSGLANIRHMYDNSTMDSFKIRQETEKMTDNLAQLNKIYERMLTAMTVNMNMQNPVR